MIEMWYFTFWVAAHCYMGGCLTPEQATVLRFPNLGACEATLRLLEATPLDEGNLYTSGRCERFYPERGDGRGD